ncbi:MAG: IS6 family transposase [Alphaproteobacteria bacterium]|nr:IS6 family transposase [Alphaproteobacteria bacterium]
MNATNYRNLDFPPSIMAHIVWLHARFNLSLRDVEEFLAERCVEVSQEAIRRWIKRVASTFSLDRRCRPYPLRNAPTFHISL